MSSDFGANARRRPKRPLTVLIVIAATVAVALAIVGAVLVMNREVKMAEAASWKIDGPPCPSLTKAAFEAARMKARKIFRYDQFTFGRAVGHVDCNQVGAQGGKALGAVTICQFTSPVMLTVKTPAGEYFYNPGVGRPTTVTIEKDVPRCVLASNFTM